MSAPNLISPTTLSGGTPVGGTGTTNTIPRWTGPSTLGDSLLTQNGTVIAGATLTGFGVGIASPTSVLHVVAQAGTGLVPVARFKSEYAAVATIGTGSTDAFFGVAGTTGYETCWNANTANYLSARVNNAEALRITSAGNVGIGTASPGYRLHVAQTSGYTQVRAQSTDTAGGARFQIQNDQDTTQFASYGSAVAGTIWGIPLAGLTAMFTGSSSTAGLAIGTGGAYPLYFATNSTERARIDSNGNIYGTSGTTGMTNGFFYIPAAAGAPTGVPTAVAGRVPMYYDTTNNQFYVYNGAWKKVTLA